MQNFDKTIQMYIFDGDPNGRIMCELSNWNGRVYKIARNDLAQFSKRQDSENTGVYFLFGKDDNTNETIYIGEAENISTRLKQHLKDEIYWNDCIVVISKDNLLNKAHVKFLENSFYNLAKDCNRSIIINSSTPTRSSISEYDKAMLVEFIENAKLLVNTLGYKTFDNIRDVRGNKEKVSQIFKIKAARGACANGLLIPDGFAVLKDSVVANTTTPSMSQSLINLRNKLYDSKIINEHNIFAKDYVFTSPSLAAAIVMGRNANGRTEWKTDDHKTLKQIEESNLDSI